MVSLVGKLEVGQVCTATVRMAGRKEVVFPTKMVGMTEGREMVFRGAPKKGLISDDHYFILTALEGGRTHFSQRVAFSGIMSPFIGGVVADTGKAIEAMNQAYKARCEDK
jgi:hypothetical protein